MIKQIWLDLGRILLYFRERKVVFAEIVKGFGGDSEAFLTGLFPPGLGEPVYEALDNGSLTNEELWKNVCMLGRVTPQALKFQDFCESYVQHLTPILPMVQLVKRLQCSYPLVVVSNGDWPARHAVEHLLEEKFSLNFEAVFISYEQRLKKPALLNTIVVWAKGQGISPQECIFVDDIEAYVREANRLGVHGILHDSTIEPLAEQVQVLKSKLRACGVEV